MKAFLLFSLAMGQNPAAHPNQTRWPAPSFPLAWPSRPAAVAQLPFQVFPDPTRSTTALVTDPVLSSSPIQFVPFLISCYPL
jgi:hypothetical protein